MSEFDTLFPMPENRRNADDMGLPPPHSKPMKITEADKLECVERELRMRHRTYIRLVRGGRMSVDVADREIILMQEIVKDYRERANGREDNRGARATVAGVQGEEVRAGAGSREGRHEGDAEAYGSDASGAAKATQAG